MYSALLDHIRLQSHIKQQHSIGHTRVVSLIVARVLLLLLCISRAARTKRFDQILCKINKRNARVLPIAGARHTLTYPRQTYPANW